MPRSPDAAGGRPLGHFRALARRPARLAVTMRDDRGAWEHVGVVVDLSLAGAGLETDEPLREGDRVSIAFSTPTRWDPLVVSAVVAWARAPATTGEVDALGRPRAAARSGVAFTYSEPEEILAVFEMIAALGLDAPART